MSTPVQNEIIKTEEESQAHYILNNNKRPYSMGVSNKPWNTLTSLTFYNSEDDSCSLNLYYAWKI